MKVTVITAFYRGNRYMDAYQRMMDANEANLADGDELEVLIVNDSPGLTVRLDGIHLSKAGWHVIANEKNSGIHQSRINGVKNATGDVLIFLDQDDHLRDDALALLLERVKRNPYTVVVANAALETSRGTKLWYRTAYHKSRLNHIKTWINVGNQIISPGQCLLNRRLIPDEWLNHVIKRNGSDDYYLWLLLLEKGISFSLLDEPLYTHKSTGENISGDPHALDSSTIEFLGYLEEDGFPPRYLKRLKKMTAYKAAFRREGLSGKIKCTAKNPGIFLANLWFKLCTLTGYGFNR